MRFIFSESYILNWNGYTARYEKGISGTHNASMYLAEALAELNHEVIFVNVFNNIIPGFYNNIKYVNLDKFDGCDCDYIITTYMVNDLLILNKILNYNKIIMIMNNPLDVNNNTNLIHNINPNKIMIAFISEFSKKNILSSVTSTFLKNYQHILLYNSINLNDIKSSTKEDSFIFFACLERGFKMSVEIINKFNNKFKLYTNTYANNNTYTNVKSDNICITENTSKNTILSYCGKSKYFLYPLINLDTNDVHYDCAPYVVLEALLSGVVVIAPKMKLFEELYGDAICYIDTNNIILNKYLESEYINNIKCINHPEFGYPVIDKYIEKLNLLEKNNELYNNYVEKGVALKEKYSNKNIVNMFLNMIDNIKDININAIYNNKILLHSRLNKY